LVRLASVEVGITGFCEGVGDGNDTDGNESDRYIREREGAVPHTTKASNSAALNHLLAIIENMDL
jgi:hypothetical protein